MEPALFTQYAAAISSGLGGFVFGSAVGYSTSAAPMLINGTDHKVQLTASQNGFFASSLALGGILGGPIGGLAMNYFGRKGSMLLSVIPSIFGWAFEGFAQNYAMLVIGRILVGISCGISAVAIPTYIGEFSSANIRGSLGFFYELNIASGIMYSFAFGVILHSFRILAAVCSLISISYFLAMMLNKESPAYLLSKGKREKAKKSMQYFRGKHYDITEEIFVVEASVMKSKQHKVGFMDLNKPYIIKPLIISGTLMFLQQFSGINAVNFNLALIFEETNSNISTGVSTIIIGVVHILATILGSYLVEWLGRRLLLLLSTSTMFLSLVLVGAYFYGDANDLDYVKNYDWLPLIALMIYYMSFCSGLGPVPYVILGEVFTPNVKELAAGIVIFVNWTSLFIVTVLYEPLTEAIGDFGVYWLFSIFCGLAFIFTLMVVVETKGKTTQEINAIFGAPQSIEDS